jgi:GntR family transcriptional regulator, histidine utilization repressor
MKRVNQKAIAPLYEKVKNHILDKINSGELLATDRVPSEHELVKALKVSRMTANRALRELAAEGVLTRVAGVGTFVSEPSSKGHLLEVTNIADEVRQRGHAYSNIVLSHGRSALGKNIALAMGLPMDSPVYRTVIVHLEEDLPIQFEDRYVNISQAKGYAKIDIESDTPSQYLLDNYPLKKVQHTVRALMPGPDIKKHLGMRAATPCLVLERLTWSNTVPLSYAILYHCADRYTLSDTFSPG